jgi:thiamine biosynthesis protein ThiI
MNGSTEMNKAVILRYGEIWIKSPGVKNIFEKILMKNVRACLNHKKVKYDEIRRSNSRIYIFGKASKRHIECARNVFGIVSLSAAKIIRTDIEEMKTAALSAYKKGKSFRITANRLTKEYGLNSQQICETVGEYVQSKTGAKVDLSNPGININLELNKDKTFVFTDYVRGFGGLPVGTQGRVACLVSGSTNSMIAAAEVMRRGCTVHLLHFDDDKAKAVKRKCDKMLGKYYPGEMRFSTIKESLTKNMMYETSCCFAKENNCNAIVSGEHDLNEIMKIKKNDLLLIFPCVGYDKNEITELAKKYEIK